MSENSLDLSRYRRLAREQPWLEALHERDLIGRAKAGDAAATETLVQSHFRLVIKIASPYVRNGLSAHDLISEGLLGVMEAIQRFDLNEPCRFSSYATWWIRAFVRKYALDNRRIVGAPSTRGARIARGQLRQTERRLHQELGRKPSHEELARALGISEQDVAMVDAALSSRDVSLTPIEGAAGFEVVAAELDPEQAFAEAEQHAVLNRSLGAIWDELSDRERHVLREQLDAADGSSLAECGRRMGVSRQRVGQIFNGARKKLRSHLSAIAV